MPAFKDVKRLFFEMNLLILRKIARQRCCQVVRDSDNFLRQGFGNDCGANCAFDAMGRKCFELGIVFRMVATMRDQKNAALAGGVCKPANIREQSFGAGYVEFATGQHEVRLRVDLPENDIARCHCRSA